MDRKHNNNVYFKDLPINSVRKIKNLIKYVNTLVIKDSRVAESHEVNNMNMSRTSFEYLAAIRKTDRLRDHIVRLGPKFNEEYYTEEGRKELLDEIREDIITNYKEYNPYYIELKEKYDIDYYTSRTADDLDLLLGRSGLLTDEEMNRFALLYSKAKMYYNNVVYNEAYEDYELYRNFTKFFIVYMAMNMYITSELEVIHDYDIFDRESLRNMFISYDMDYFYDLPVYYQRRLLKNLNDLIKHKGTNTAIVNIVELFGFDDVKIFKHFLGKSYYKDGNGNLDLTNPDVHFYKIDYRDKNIQKEIQYYEKEDFDIFVSGDPFWHAKKDEVLQEQFNLINSKYFSVESSLDIVKYNTAIAYLYNALKYIETNFEIKASMSKAIPNSDFAGVGPINLLDMVVGIHYLTLKRLGYKDNIVKEVSSLTRLYAFNFDIEELYSKYPEVFENVDDKWLIKTFNKDSNTIDVNEFVEVMNHNLELKYQLECAINTAHDYESYKNLKCLYELQFKSEQIKELFNGHDTYGSFLEERNEDFYNVISSEYINIDKTITELFIAIEQIMGGMYSILMENPIIINFLKQFIIKLINIFKFYTTKLKDFDIIYSIRDPYENRIRLVEKLITNGSIESKDDLIYIVAKMNLKGYYTLHSKISIEDYLIAWYHIVGSECISVDDKVDIYSFIEGEDYLSIKDKIYEIKAKYTVSEDLDLKEKGYITTEHEGIDRLNICLWEVCTVTKEKKNYLILKDDLSSESNYSSFEEELVYDKLNVLPPILYPKDNLKLCKGDNLNIYNSLNLDEYTLLIDSYLKMYNKSTYRTNINVLDKLNVLPPILYPKSRYEIRDDIKDKLSINGIDIVVDVSDTINIESGNYNSSNIRFKDILRVSEY